MSSSSHTSGSKLLSKAGEEADNLLASKNLFLPDRLKDLASCVHLRQVRDDGQYLAKLAEKTQPFAKSMKKLREVDMKRRRER